MASLQVLTEKKKKKTLKGYIKVFTAPNSEIIQEYFEPCVNSGIFRTLVYLESWHIQNQRHTQKPVISKTLAHSEPETYSEP